MTKPVTLSNHAFAALRKEKKSNESDSDVVTRLIAEAATARRTKDPQRWVRAGLEPVWSGATYQRKVKEWRAEDRDVWADARKRNRSKAKGPA